ncbi:MAG: PD-(D/E)XK nuclease family protein [Oscillospiraceae bacterium]|nr:PD-(D/E)XK nuclease family protein [Oscillospiraceae bacterium]
MLTLLLGTDWVANRAEIMHRIACDVADQKEGRILIVPELISHETERRLCAAAGDTTSRFAEVLTFTGLARRVSDTVGLGARECLDNGGRVVTMASATRQLHSKLKAYAAVETKPEFLLELLDAVDEFKRCCISAEDLLFASKQTEGSLAQKLEELSLILEAYNALCQQGKRDPRDQMTWLLEELESGNYAKDHTFYIDGFPDFTRQHMAILEHLIQNSDNVIVSVNCDCPGSADLAFEKAGETAAQLLSAAKKFGIAVEVCQIAPRGGSLEIVRKNLFQGKICTVVSDGSLQVYTSDTMYQECVAVAEKITKMIMNGSRYRQIGIVCADMEGYRSTVDFVLRSFGIPAYISGTESVLDKTVITTVLAALDAALGGFEREQVLSYLKSPLSPLDLSACDMVENYAILWGIDGRRWLEEWTNHPDALGGKWTDGARQTLRHLNSVRAQAIDPLEHLKNSFDKAGNLSQQVEALYGFFTEIKLAERLDALATQADNNGDNRSAQILNQLWEILLVAMEQLHDMLGNTVWEPEVFTRLFKLLLSQYSVGTIPTVLDSVVVGPVSAMRCQKTAHLFVLGALEGNLPGYSGSSGVLNDQERVMLRQLGVPLTGGATEGLQAEFAEIYGAFCGADSSVTVSCPGGQPSFIYRRMSQLAGGDTAVTNTYGAALRSIWHAGAFFAAQDQKESADAAGVADAYAGIHNHKNHALGRISREHIDSLYGKELKLSASQIDKQAQCRFSYFVRYGLRAKECKEASVDPAEFGTYVHSVLENTVCDVMKKGGFEKVSLEETLQIAQKHSTQYASERFEQIDSERLTYLFRRNGVELALIVRELWQELKASEFAPVGFEVGFGDEGEVPAICVTGEHMSGKIRGFVDRIDAWQSGQNTFYRVVDYKTGEKDFDYCDVMNGIGLQMLLYLFALEEGLFTPLGENPIPAGVQYFPARVPVVSANSKLSDEEAAAERQKLWKRKGLLLNDEVVLGAMSDNDTISRMPYSIKKDGILSGDLADIDQFKKLKAYVFKLLGGIVDEIASGNVAPNPYTRGSGHNPCTYCPYGSICHQNTVQDRRNFKAITANQFWQQIEKEVSTNG